MKRTSQRLLTVITVFFFLAAWTVTVSGARLPRPLPTTYLFGVDKETVDVYIEGDGTVRVDYVLDFQNDPSADPIDYVDIGTPTQAYTLGDVSANVNGTPVFDIQKSEYVEGVAIGLGTHAIPAGQKGRLQVSIPGVKNMLFPAEASAGTDYASFNFMPNFFESKYINGSTDITVTIHMPPGLTETEPKYYLPKDWPGDQNPSSGFDANDRIFFRWESKAANVYSQYTFGGAFPKKFVPAGAIINPPLFKMPAFEDMVCWGFGCLIVFFFIWSIYEGTVGARKRKLAYLPPKIKIEGNGIKRGLTAVEAAVLMEQPLDKVLTMVLFGVVKKGAGEVTTREPLAVKTITPQPEGLQPYESDFLAAFQAARPADRKKALSAMMVKIVKGLSEKMKGFSRKETIAYYTDIMTRAWAQVESANTPEVKSAKYDEVMEWTMLDKDYNGRTRNTFGQGPVFLPTWWGRYDPVYRGATFSTPTISGPSMSNSVSLPHLPGSDFAASVVNGVSSFSSNVIGDITNFTSGITNQTNPPPPPSKSSGSSGGGGGRSCACACACAGCACACAGGGR
jgi:hypothetical protein